MSSSAPRQQAKADSQQITTQRGSQEVRQNRFEFAGEAQHEFADLRPETTAQRFVQATANTSEQAKQLRSLQQMAQASERSIQLKAMTTMMHASTLQRVEDDDPLHKKPRDKTAVQRTEESALKPNDSGLSLQLKAGIESLSGMSMDHVKVHYNSSQPAQLNAHAYAQGSDIHLAPGQEQHLPHEAWHVVQQAKGRVQPTMQMKAGVAVNDDAGLEHEADLMGAKAMGQGAAQLIVQGAAKMIKPSPMSNSRFTNTTYSNNTLQMRLLPRKSIAMDLAHYPDVRKALFNADTLKAYPGPQMLNSGEMESQIDYANSLMQQNLEEDPRISYNLLAGTTFFAGGDSWRIVSHLKKTQADAETMFLLKNSFTGFAKKADSNDIHPRIFGGMPDVDMAGTVTENTLSDIPVGGRDINKMTFKEQRKALMGWQGNITFTNNSGHFRFESIPNDVQNKLTSLIKDGGDLTEDVVVKFKAV